MPTTIHSFATNEKGVGHWTTKRIQEYKPKPNEKILDIACGVRKIPGAIGLDSDQAVHPDIAMDCTEPLPFESESIDTVFCLNFLEHTPKFDKVLGEIHRVLKKRGIVHIEVPYYNSFNFGQVPFHFVPFCETILQEFFGVHGAFSRYSKSKFEILETELFFTAPAKFIPARFRIKLARYIGNLCYQIYWEARKA